MEATRQRWCRRALDLDRDLRLAAAHLGQQGADYYAATVIYELAREVPERRPLLIP
jgi:hypothetical protein